MFFGVIIGYVIEAKYLGGYLNLAAVIKNGLLGGAVVGGLLGFVLKGQGKDEDGRFTIFAGLLVFGLASGPLMVSLLNRISCEGPVLTEFELVKLEPIMKTNIGIIEGEVFKPDGHRATISKDGEIYDIEIGEDLTLYRIDDDKILLKICSGRFGFEFVEPASRLNKGQLS